MSGSKMRIIVGALVLSASSGIGLLLSPATASSQSSAFDCEWNLCDVGGGGNCFVTDVSWMCKEVLGGCEAVYCKAQ